MNLEEYQTLFVATTLALTLVAATPTLDLVISIQRPEKSFSELWVLGPDHMAEDYPLNITIGQKKILFVGVGNYMGSSTYYLVYTKFRNQTQPLPDTNSSIPSPVPSLYEFRFFLADGQTWETTLSFTILNASIRNNSLVVSRVSVNDMMFEGEYPTKRDSGLFYQVFLELWLYNMTAGKFHYHNRFVSIWLKITG